MNPHTLAIALLRPAACLVAILLVGMSAPVAGSEGNADDRTPLQYVAMGDSFSAASGVLPLDLTAPLLCQRSTRNYPRLIAAATDAELTDVTCGGATTGNYFTSQYPGVPPQLEALTPHTELVTMTIGLNDSSLFLRVQALCATAGILTLGSGSPCQDQHGSSFADIIESTTFPSLVKALRAIRAQAPQARVAVLGIPWILPRSVGCFPKMPVARGDVPYIRGIQATLNGAIQRAAATTGAEFVDFAEASEGHDSCQPAGVRWIEPALIGSNPIIVHPNALGEAKMAAQTMRTLGLGPAQHTATTGEDH
ncbi:MAG: SGNH/GDSL hydrolase family protein [Propionibacteriales bacterium]|nr:SGNH/GDSL hydrolase family protein [Propionibacteriales bacterium]